MKEVIVLAIILIQINFIFAVCNEEQIDINTASKEELDKLYGIGVVKAQAIIDSRPFSSVDNLIDVNGIGEKTLEGIKNQGLACVENEENSEEEIDNTADKDNVNIQSKEDDPDEIDDEPVNTISNSKNVNKITSNEILELKPIVLNQETKDIKTEEDGNLNNKSYVIYGTIAFFILLALLFLLRNRKYKEEE